MGEDAAAALVVTSSGDLARRPGVQKLNHSHEAICRWLLENPAAPLGDCARHFGYTQSWLSCIIHSDAFQVKLRQMQTEADAVVVMDVPARLRGVAAAALDGIAAQVDHALKDGNGVLHRQFLHDTAELTLKALGYGQPKTSPAPAVGAMHFHQHNHTTVAPEVLANARGRLLESHAIQEASQLPAGGSGDLSPVQRHPADLSSPTSTEGTETSRADISGASGGVAE